MNYASLKETDIADGPGVRVALYVSGCQLALEGKACPGCHNFEAWDKNYGKEFTDETEKKIIQLLKPDYISGFSLLGGEPLSSFNIDREIKLLKHIKEEYPSKDIWMWTGYIIDDWIKYHDTKILKYIDTVVDGPFDKDLFDPSLKFRGSSNQRIINVKDLKI